MEHARREHSIGTRAGSADEVLNGAGADAVLAASVFHFGDLTIGEVKESLREAGNPVR